jgi:hypothetical protein
MVPLTPNHLLPGGRYSHPKAQPSIQTLSNKINSPTQNDLQRCFPYFQKFDSNAMKELIKIQNDKWTFDEINKQSSNFESCQWQQDRNEYSITTY